MLVMLVYNILELDESQKVLGLSIMTFKLSNVFITIIDYDCWK